MESWSGLVNQQDATFTQDSDIRFAQLPLIIDVESCLFTWKNINKLKLCDTKSKSSMFEVFPSQISKGWCNMSLFC